jgi:2-(1,2-epoxy-1,2-dihydrophenyl)acetyl-CoA isomerase
MSSDTIHHSDERGVRTVTIDRPESKNAITVPMRGVLADLMRESHADPDVRAIVITGAGGTFCSGADVKGMEQLKDPESARARVETIQNVARSIATGPTPVVAAVEGIAFGAGLGIALACDHIVAATDARLSAAFVNVGLFADIGVLFTLPQRVGPARARTMMLLAQMVHADEALRIGLVDQLSESGTALERATEVAMKLAAGPPLAIAAVKRAFTGLPTSLAESLETETAMQAPLLGSEDFLEAIAAFAEKRAPTFSGI